jgi:hypothetical protein
MSADDLLLQLRSIAPPTDPGWWPLAPGWWILIIVCLLSMLVLLYSIRRRHKNRNFKLASQELRRISNHHARNRDNQSLLLNLSRWLRQVSLIAFPRRKIAGMTGVAWLEFLDEVMGHSEFRRGPGQVFATAVYSRQLEFDDDRILALCEAWMTSLKPHLENRGRSR